MVVVLVLAMTVPSPVVSVVAAQRPRVPLTAPDTVPAWVGAPKNLASDTGASYQYYADIILVSFTPHATQTERQTAIDAVHGEVVGGQPMPTGEGFYYVRLNARRRLEPLSNAVTTLLSFPRVAAASLLTPLIVQDHGSLLVVSAPQDTTRPPVPTLPNLPADTMLTVERTVLPQHYRDHFRRHDERFDR